MEFEMPNGQSGMSEIFITLNCNKLNKELFCCRAWPAGKTIRRRILKQYCQLYAYKEVLTLFREILKQQMSAENFTAVTGYSTLISVFYYYCLYRTRFFGMVFIQRTIIMKLPCNNALLNERLLNSNSTYCYVNFPRYCRLRPRYSYKAQLAIM